MVERGHGRNSPPGNIAAAIDALFEDYEAIGDTVIPRLADEPRLPALKHGLATGRPPYRNWVAQALAPDLARPTEKEREELHNALTAAATSMSGSCYGATSACRARRPGASSAARSRLSPEPEGKTTARILWLNWCGGANLPPSLGIARVLEARGHQVTFAGRPEMVPRVTAAGFRALEPTKAYAQVERYLTGTPLTRAACYITSPAVGTKSRRWYVRKRPTSC